MTIQNRQPISATLPTGMRDHGPRTMRQRQYITQILKRHFERYSFLPLETPAMEHRRTLLGQYGEDAAPLIFNVLNSGDFLSNSRPEDRHATATLLPTITRKSLRYDLTLPLARYVAAHAHTLTFPFRRYQIQPVWRADRPQKGRFREFYQCDIDMVGTSSLICEAELIALMHDAFRDLKLDDFTIRLNHRQLLQGIAEQVGLGDQVITLCTALDKWDKIGADGVWDTLARQQVPKKAIQQLQNLLTSTSDASHGVLFMDRLADQLQGNAQAMQGIEDLRTILGYVKDLSVEKAKIRFTPTLARGLSYYTGPIFEVTTTDNTLGSIGGGGRYANLTALFGLKNTPGTGFSFGLDRIQTLLAARNLFPASLTTTPRVLITQFDAASISHNLHVLAKFRQQGITATIYPTVTKLGKQLQYAQKHAMPYVILIGETERATQTIILRHMAERTQKGYAWPELLVALKGSRHRNG